MPSEQAIQKAKQIFDDFRGSGYYADPAILGGFLKEPQGTDADGTSAAVGVLRYLLMTYVPKDSTETDVEQLAATLERSRLVSNP